MEEEGIQNPFTATRHQRLDSLRKLVDSGVKFVSGNDAGVTMTGFDDFQLDLELLVEHIGFSAATPSSPPPRAPPKRSVPTSSAPSPPASAPTS